MDLLPLQRSARVTLNRGALKHNLKRVRQCVPDAKVMSAIKADAYGHGMEIVADALTDSDSFGISGIDDVRRLRKYGVTKDLVALSALLVSVDHLRQFAELGAQVVIYDETQLDLLEQFSREGEALVLKIWLKLDTGMSRLGFNVANYSQTLSRATNLPNIELVGLMSHLACADEPEHAQNAQQLECWEKIMEVGVEGLSASLLNSGGILHFSDQCSDVVRPGIMLYGAAPCLLSAKPNDVESISTQLAAYDLAPVMTFTADVLSVKSLKEGDCVGYGATYKCPKPTQIALLGVGYGDGYPRHAPSGTPVLVNGKRAALVGRVSMDIIAIDVTGIDCQVGDEAELWGDNLRSEEVARWAQTIPYELYCGITNRVVRQWIDS